MNTELEISKYAQHYLQELREGNSENAYFSLVEADSSIVPLLQDAYYQEDDVSIKAQIVEIISQHRLSHSIGFLVDRIKDGEPCVWRAALDGMVMQSSQASLKALEIISTEINDSERVEWIKEAINQLDRKIKAGNS